VKRAWSRPPRALLCRVQCRARSRTPHRYGRRLSRSRFLLRTRAASRRPPLPASAGL